MIYLNNIALYVLILNNFFSYRNKRSQTGNSGRRQSIAQVAVNLLCDRQYTSGDQSSK